MTLARIKKGDDVLVLAGRERGKRGVVRQVMPSKGTALVQDINISKRHLKPSGQARQAGIVDVEQPIHLSNLALVDPEDAASRPASACASWPAAPRCASPSPPANRWPASKDRSMARNPQRRGRRRSRRSRRRRR